VPPGKPSLALLSRYRDRYRLVTVRISVRSSWCGFPSLSVVPSGQAWQSHYGRHNHPRCSVCSDRGCRQSAVVGPAAVRTVAHRGSASHGRAVPGGTVWPKSLARPRPLRNMRLDDPVLLPRRLPAAWRVARRRPEDLDGSRGIRRLGTDPCPQVRGRQQEGYPAP